MLTIHEALELSVFDQCQLVAGEGGLDNQIQWVHIVDLPHTDFLYDRRGVLLLTAGYGWRETSEDWSRLIQQLSTEGYAGMVLSTGYYFDEAPVELREAANDRNFPVIESPKELMFIEITKTVLERLVNLQYALLRQSNQIHQQLTELVLRGGGLSALATNLADILNRSVTIESPSFRVLANANIGEIDGARHHSVTRGRTPPEIAQRMLEAGIYDKLLQRMGPMHVLPRPDLGMTLERYVAPIIVDREIYGYIWMLAGEEALTELDKLALGHAATVAALIMFKEKAVQEAEAALRGDFLEQLLRGDTQGAGFTEQARRLGFRPGQTHQVLLISGVVRAGSSIQPLQQDVRNWLHQRNFNHSLLIQRDNQLVLIIEKRDGRRGRNVAEGIIRDLNHPAGKLLISIGQPAQGNLRHSYETAQEALRIAVGMGKSEGISDFDELGVLHWLYHLPSDARNGNVYLSYIKTLASFDGERKTELLKTLETYLEQGGSLVDTSQLLYIHRNTLLNRLDRIKKLLNLDLRDAHHRLNLFVAIKSYRLHQNS